MIRFKIITPYSKAPNSKWYGIECDPTLENEVYLYANKKDISFDECICIFEKTLCKTNFLGVMSLIYFKYYREFYDYLFELRCNSRFNNTRRISIFKKKYLDRWIEFIKHSDDCFYPQNNYFMKMNDLFNETKDKCPCCGNRTLDPYNRGYYDICPVCFWEDESAENDNPEKASEVNHISLIETRKNFNKYGACKKELVKYVRKPNEDEKVIDNISDLDVKIDDNELSYYEQTRMYYASYKACACGECRYFEKKLLPSEKIIVEEERNSTISKVVEPQPSQDKKLEQKAPDFVKGK